MTSTDPERLHRESIVVDGLNASHFRHPVVLEQLEAGGVTAVHLTVAAWHDARETVAEIAEHLALFEQNAGRVLQVRKAADIFGAKAAGRVGVILGFQGGEPIEDNLKLLAVYHALGVRIIQLTYNATNRLGSGYRVTEDLGLTSFGREAIAEMNRLGILIDLSHCGNRTTREAIEASRRPVAVTHANSRRLCNHHRNKDPEALKALAAKGGVVGAMVFALSLTGTRHATLEDYFKALDDLVDLVGVDHVGLGPDFMEKMPQSTAELALRGFLDESTASFLNARPTKGIETIASAGHVTRELLERGYAERDVRKIIGSNWLRLYQSSWEPEGRRQEPGPRMAPSPAGRA